MNGKATNINWSFKFSKMRRNVWPCVQTPPSSPWHDEPEVVRSGPHLPHHPPLLHQPALQPPFERSQWEFWSCWTMTSFLWKRPTSGGMPLDAACLPPASSSSGPSSISSTSGTWQSSEIRQSASLADPFRPDIGRLPEDSPTVSLFCSRWYSWFNSLFGKYRNQAKYR